MESLWYQECCYTIGTPWTDPKTAYQGFKDGVFPSSGFRQGERARGFSIRARNTAVFFFCIFFFLLPLLQTPCEKGRGSVNSKLNTRNLATVPLLCLDSPVCAVGISVVSRKQSILYPG